MAKKGSRGVEAAVSAKLPYSGGFRPGAKDRLGVLLAAGRRRNSDLHHARSQNLEFTNSVSVRGRVSRRSGPERLEKGRESWHDG